MERAGILLSENVAYKMNRYSPKPLECLFQSFYIFSGENITKDQNHIKVVPFL